MTQRTVYCVIEHTREEYQRAIHQNTPLQVTYRCVDDDVALLIQLQFPRQWCAETHKIILINTDDWQRIQQYYPHAWVKTNTITGKQNG